MHPQRQHRKQKKASTEIDLASVDTRRSEQLRARRRGTHNARTMKALEKETRTANSFLFFFDETSLCGFPVAARHVGNRPTHKQRQNKLKNTKSAPLPRTVSYHRDGTKKKTAHAPDSFWGGGESSGNAKLFKK